MTSKESNRPSEPETYTIPSSIFQEVASETIGRELTQSELQVIAERLDDYIGFDHICNAVVECIDDWIGS